MSKVNKKTEIKVEINFDDASKQIFESFPFTLFFKEKTFEGIFTKITYFEPNFGYEDVEYSIEWSEEPPEIESEKIIELLKTLIKNVKL